MTPDGPKTNDAGPSGPKKGVDRLALGFLGLCFALLLHCAWRVGPTFDEHFYVAAGHAYWETGDFALNREHPPLGKLLVGLPLQLAPDVQTDAHALERVGYPVWFLFQKNAEHLARNFFLARLPVILLTLLGAWVVYRYASRVFGRAGGRIALVAFAFNPNVVAQGSLAALDAMLMVFFFLATLAYVELQREPTWRRALGAALLFGLANLTKQTALLLGPGFVIGALLVALGRRRLAPLGWCAVVFLGGFGVFAAGYGFEARSLDEVRGNPYYASAKSAVPGSDLAARKALADAARGEQLRDLALAIDGSESTPAAIALIDARLASADPEEARAVERILAALARVPGGAALRRQAFHLLLEREAEEPLPTPRNFALSALAGTRRFLAEDPAVARDAWRAWWSAGGSRSFSTRIFTQPWIERLVLRLFGEERPVPLLSALKGLDYQLDASQSGHGSVFRGRPLLPRDFKDGNPHPEYYATVLAIKNSLPWLALVVAGLLLSVVGSSRAPAWDRVRRVGLVGAPLALLVFFSSGKALMGARYILPVFPFLALAAGRVGATAPRVGLGVALLGAFLGLRYHPHHLMYYQELVGGPRGGPAISVVSDDWGQGVRAMGGFAAEHAALLESAGGLHYEPYSVADPAAYGLERIAPVTGRVQGIVAVHALSYWRDVLPGGVERRYAWLDDYEPFQVVDQSVYVFDTREPAPGGNPLVSGQ